MLIMGLAVLIMGLAVLIMGLAVLIMIGFIVMLFGPVCYGFRVVSVVMTVMIRAHLQTTGGEDAHDTQGEEYGNRLRAMSSPSENECTQTKCNRNQREEPLGRLVQQKVETHGREDDGQERADGTVNCAQRAGHRAQSVG